MNEKVVEIQQMVSDYLATPGKLLGHQEIPLMAPRCETFNLREHLHDTDLRSVCSSHSSRQTENRAVKKEQQQRQSVPVAVELEKKHDVKEQNHEPTTNSSNACSTADSKSETASLAEMLCNMLKQQSALNVDLEAFDGDPMNYHYFMALFTEVVVKNISDPRGRLTRLIKYTKGDAKDLIQHCIQLPSPVGYEKAMAMLARRYGDPYTVMASYRLEIKEWPAIKGGDPLKLRQFHNFLIKCQSISGLSWNTMNNPDTICTLLGKLPLYITDKWN